MRPWLSWIEHRSSKPTVTGSNPVGRTLWGTQTREMYISWLRKREMDFSFRLCLGREVGNPTTFFIDK